MATETLYIEDQVKNVERLNVSEIASKTTSVKVFLFICASVAIFFVFLIIIFLFYQGGSFFLEYPLDKFLFEGAWRGQDEIFGANYIIWGTILIALGALIIAIPLGLGTAIFIAEIAPPKMRSILKGSVEILSGIPSVVYGYFGHVILKEWIEVVFDIPLGLNWLNASILLALMALPTIVSVCEDAITAVPRHYREASYAMGATKWQTIRKVVIPAGMSGITAGIILGMGRAIGETMAVTMAGGGNIIFPDPVANVFSGLRTITATIALELKEAVGLHVQALFALGIVLFIITLIINSLANMILTRLNNKFMGKIKEKKWKRSNFIQMLNNDNGIIALKQLFRRNKKLIRNFIVILFLIWLFSMWFGLILGSIIIFGLYGLKFVSRNNSLERKQKMAFAIIIACSIFVLVSITILIGNIIFNGLPRVLDPEFLTTYSQADSGGILDVIIGTLQLTGLCLLFSVPIGVLAGVYLSEYAKDTRINKIIRAGIDNLNGTPSIVFGLFGYLFFVLPMGGRNWFAGSAVLALMILPTIVRTTEEACKAIPQTFREGSLALGSSKWQSISKIVLPSAMPAIITGVILGMGRAAGETAPIIFTAATFVQSGIARDPFKDTVMALTFHLYVLVVTYPNSKLQAGGTALTLLMLILLMYGLAFLIRRYYNRKKKW